MVQIYLINLDRATERLDRMNDVLRARDLSFTRVPAVDGAKLTLEERQRYVSGEGRWGWLTAGEIGCFLSHRECWRRLLESGDEYAVIFEDDILLGENVGDMFHDMSWMPADADLIKIEATHSRTYVDAQEKAIVGGRAVTRLRSSHYCCGGYIVSRGAASILLERSLHFCDPVDDYMFSITSKIFREIKIYQIIPAACAQLGRALGENELDSIYKSSISGRESKVKRKFGILNRVHDIYIRELNSLINKILCIFSVRMRLIIPFR